MTVRYHGSTNYEMLGEIRIGIGKSDSMCLKYEAICNHCVVLSTRDYNVRTAAVEMVVVKCNTRICYYERTPPRLIYNESRSKIPRR